MLLTIVMAVCCTSCAARPIPVARITVPNDCIKAITVSEETVCYRLHNGSVECSKLNMEHIKGCPDTLAVIHAK